MRLFCNTSMTIAPCMRMTSRRDSSPTSLADRWRASLADGNNNDNDSNTPQLRTRRFYFCSQRSSRCPLFSSFFCMDRRNARAQTNFSRRVGVDCPCMHAWARLPPVFSRSFLFSFSLAGAFAPAPSFLSICPYTDASDVFNLNFFFYAFVSFERKKDFPKQVTRLWLRHAACSSS